MTSITSHYGIYGRVPFLDTRVDADNQAFVDPRAIRESAAVDPFAASAVHSIDTFFGTVSSCAMSSNPADRKYGHDLLTKFAEPWETRLGMSKDGYRGKGGAEDVGRWIWESMTTDLLALLNLGVFARLEQLPLFVEGVDRDITSDITTRIVFEPLVQFTASMLTAYPQFTAGRHVLEVVNRQVWNPTMRAWEVRKVFLPSVDGAPLLLVPHGWARSRLLMSAGRYHGTTLLGYVQDERAVEVSGELVRTPKRELRRLPELRYVRPTNRSVTTRAAEESVDLLAMFDLFVAERLAEEQRKSA